MDYDFLENKIRFEWSLHRGYGVFFCRPFLKSQEARRRNNDHSKDVSWNLVYTTGRWRVVVDFFNK